jgi:hypothetical protein
MPITDPVEHNLLEKMTVAQLAKNFPALYEIQRSIT